MPSLMNSIHCMLQKHCQKLASIRKKKRKDIGIFKKQLCQRMCGMEGVHVTQHACEVRGWIYEIGFHLLLLQGFGALNSCHQAFCGKLSLTTEPFCWLWKEILITRDSVFIKLSMKTVSHAWLPCQPQGTLLTTIPYSFVFLYCEFLDNQEDIYIQ